MWGNSWTAMNSLGILRLQGYDRFYWPWWTGPMAIMTIIGIFTVWRLSVMFYRWWNQPIQSPDRLFQELCSRHRLTKTERHLLKKIATDGSFDPNFLFIDPELWPVSPSGSKAESQREQLFEKLFGVRTSSSE
ncbi:MAG: hypothetical protein FJ308_22725 [Planctomycetes bacterium]|nr:hypothetical protein [Planctomycetota bacterium]